MTAASLDSSTSNLVSVTVSGSGPAVHVSAVGEVDSTSAPVLRERLEALLDGDVRDLTVDLGQVTFLDSAGLCVLAAAHRRATRQDVTMRVLASSRAVIRPLQITGLWELLGAQQVDGTAAGSAGRHGAA
ncbi:STAS domain-containing protein [Blastococcus deserti]|uniref:Anti-sigma factor antagonist n=1 Tax=Blastococcus deserti TaxID=2259033 RepID=A0ABW4XG36_9ACTN